MDIQFIHPTDSFLKRVAEGEISAEVEKKFLKFLERVNQEFLSHPAVTGNEYTNWFREGLAQKQDLRNLTVQFSIFSNYFLVAQLKKMIHSRSIESMRLAKEILTNELGVVFRDPKKTAEEKDEDSILGLTGTVEGGTFHFRAAHFEWLVDFAKPLDLEFDELSRMSKALYGTKFFCDELERLYGGEDQNVSSGAGFAVENWAAAGFWQELEDGLRTIKKDWLPELPLSFWTFHNRLEAQHAEHTHHELEEVYFEDDFDADKFIAGGIEMLDGVKAFWDDLEKQRRVSNNPLGIKRFDHVEFYVDDCEKWADYHVQKLGLYRRAYGNEDTGLIGRKAVLVGQGRVNFLFVQASGKSPEAEEIRAHVKKHGNGVKDVAFRVQNTAEALKHCQKMGVEILRDLDEHEIFIGGSIAVYGDTTHTFIQRKRHDTFAPGYVNLPVGMEDGEILFNNIDHIVANVENMDEWVTFYARVFGFDQVGYFDIKTEKSSLVSKVVGDDEFIKLPINEPSSKNSQIQEFLNEYKSAGVQHIALSSPDIIGTIREMRRQKMDFLYVPDNYYETVPERCGQIKENLDDLKEQNILVDRDREDGYLLQLFTKPIFDRPTLFYEIIQRRGNSEGFGEGNFQALFEAIEREQELRGNL
jgi:4-hydroxyphenylpyruvate dioxygenase